MTSIEFIDETVLVEAHFLPGDQVQIEAFVWRGHRYPVTSTGRQWQEARLQHSLVQAGRPEGTYELCLDPETGEWRLLHAWLPRHVV